MSQGIRSHATRGALWSALNSLGMRLIHFVVGVILARLLLPEQFGLLAMVAVFILITQACVDGGFAVALIQQKEISSLDSSSVFYANLVLAVILAAALCLAAPFVAAFYSQPLVTDLVRTLSVVLVIDAGGRVHGALLSRKLDFRTQAMAALLAAVIAGAVGVTLALRGYGVWSLVWQQIVASAIRTALLWTFHAWRPGAHLSFQSLGRMFRFGSHMLASSLINQVFNNLYEVVIARWYSPLDVGYYYTASRLQNFPSRMFSTMAVRVGLPVFSALQEQPARLRNAMRRAIQTAMFLNAPVMVGLGAAAPEIVTALLTEKWLPCVPLLQLLCLQGLLLPLQTLNLNALVAIGRSDLFLKLEIAKKVLVVASIALTLRYGIQALIIGQTAVAIASYFMNNFPVSRLLGYSARRQILDIAPQLLLAAVIGLVIWWLPQLGDYPVIVHLACQVLLGITIYFGVSAILRVPGFSEVEELVRGRLPSLVQAFRRRRGSSPRRGSSTPNPGHQTPSNQPDGDDKTSQVAQPHTQGSSDGRNL